MLKTIHKLVGLLFWFIQKTISEFGSAKFVGKTEHAQLFHISLLTEKIATILENRSFMSEESLHGLGRFYFLPCGY